ncbi:SusC/RagA family TonB-linked outer membrane protein [Pedobacter puniceum]|uniref:SusC/RagA family TonB-linked outer membrane protein n=1 Tax=Pedobacter puniceum TaxID=2666136 RepID=A0A7K0FQS0_9SPHI|nr:TonB-dependent receptor [Pedobacter puniceum]MRX47630.1 SusC/RagA family TonB-linked outer membrane protein [Pedobacter puniceum]
MTFLNRKLLFANSYWLKMLIAMKLMTFLVFAGIMQLHAAVYSQSFNLHETDITVKQMFQKIEKESKYSIFFRQDQVNLNKKIKVIAENADIKTVMKQVLQNQALVFDLIDDMIVIKASSTAAVDYVINGTIVDEQGLPLPGASVTIKGTTNGTLTNVDGKFSINISGQQATTLVVTYLGFKQQEISVSSSQTTVNITLVADASQLDEVVVIGYGTVRKRDLTGSVSSVKAEDIVRTPTHNAVEALQGRVAGADIVRSTGAAGGNANIVIRGNRSIASNRDDVGNRNGPLIIVDGFQGNSIDAINPNDIESIEVLKDASSTAIYGAQGANGVIIVTTKKGSAGKVKVNYDAYYGINTYDFPSSRTGESYIKLRREAARTIGITDDQLVFDGPGELDAIQAGQFVDWMDLVIRDGSQQSHNVSITGGSEKTSVFGSAGYFKEDGMLRGNDFNRYNLRLNLDQTVNNWMKVGFNTQIVYSALNNRQNPLGQATQISPLGTPFNQDGTINLFPLPDGTTISPLADERNEFIARNNTLRNNIVANAYISVSPLNGLNFRSNIGTNFNNSRQGIFNDRTSLAQNGPRISVASQNTAFNRYINWDNILTYTKNIKDHNLVLTGITSYQQSDVDRLSASGQGQILASQLFYDLNSSSTSITRTIGSAYEGWSNMAYAARVNYSYKGKYLFTASGRYDGASRLSPGNKWDFFPSAAIGWNIFEESFMKNIRQVNNLKLRASYGISGNYNIGVYSTQNNLNSSSNMSFGDVPVNSFVFRGTVGNTNLGWEKTASLDIGLDFGLFNNRISGSVQWYEARTSDILLSRTLPLSTGMIDVTQNIASTKNSGIELEITSRNIQTKNFTWSSTLTYNRKKEKITELIDGRDIFPSSGFERSSLLLGRPITSFYTYDKLGIWQLNEAEEAAKYKVGGHTFQPGDIKLRDINGDFLISSADLTYVGSTVPDWIAGLQNNFTYKNFDLGVFLVARYGQTIDAEFLGRFNPAGTGNGPEILDYWTPENPTNDFPRPRRGTTLSSYAGYTGYQALNFVDGSFFKVKTVTLGYTLPQIKSGKSFYNRVRVYATANNLLTVAKSSLIRNYDPERGGAENSPLSRTFVFGLNVGF